MVDPRTPVIVGVGQRLQRDTAIEDSQEPVELMARCVRAAAADAGLVQVPRDIDSIRVVNLLSWRYHNPALVLAEQLGISSNEFAYARGGGNTPQALMNTTARDIAEGRLDVAILAGGEAWRTRTRAQRAGAHLAWRKAPKDQPTVDIGADLDMTHDVERRHDVWMPIQIYPLFESAIRRAAGRTPDEQTALVADLWSRCSAVASSNPYAWSRRALTPTEVRTVSPQNRMIGLPYTKFMNSNNDVDMAAAVLVCSADWATRNNITRDRWVFPIAGSDCNDTEYVSNRRSLATAPAVGIAATAALEIAGLGVDDISIIDLYSCFPSAVQVGATALGVSLERGLTRTGGLPFAGGPWNNYSMHAIATVVTELRDNSEEYGLIWANGGLLTKHSFGIYSAHPPPNGFRTASPQPKADSEPTRPVVSGTAAAGHSTIEAYTVMHDHDGTPRRAIAAVLTSDGCRAWATSEDEPVVRTLLEGEWVGQPVAVQADSSFEPSTPTGTAIHLRHSQR